MRRGPNELSPGRLIESPWILGALLLWALNDHVFKRQIGGPLTGKVSDVVCLIVIPVLVGAAAELMLRKDRFRRAHLALAAAAFSAALIMILINVWSPAGAAYEWGMGALRWPFEGVARLFGGEGFAHPVREVRLWMDPSDGWTAPAALLPVWLSQRRLRKGQATVTA